MATKKEEAQDCFGHIMGVLDGRRAGLKAKLRFSGNIATSILKANGGKVSVADATWTVEKTGDSLVITGQSDVLALLESLLEDEVAYTSSGGTIIVQLSQS